EDVHVAIEVPLVAAALAALPVLVTLAILVGIVLARLGIEMAAGEEDLLAVGPEVAAGGLAHARADAAITAAWQVHDEDLVKGIAGTLLLGLEDDLLAVGREVPLTGPDEIKGDLTNVREVRCLLLLPLGRSLKPDKET